MVSLYDDDGSQVTLYDELISDLRNGDIIKFKSPQGKIYKFEFDSMLGKGQSSIVLNVKDITKNKIVALRLPLTTGLVGWSDIATYTDTIAETVEEYESLKKMPIRIPELYDSVIGQFVSQEIIEFQLSMYDFFVNPFLYSNLILEKAENDLYEFARMTSQIKKIGDFKDVQLVYNYKKREWILLDWNLGGEMIDISSSAKQKTLFDGFLTRLKRLRNNEDVHQLNDMGEKMYRNPTEREIRILKNIFKNIYEKRIENKRSCFLKIKAFFGRKKLSTWQKYKLKFVANFLDFVAYTLTFFQFTFGIIV